MSDLSISGVNTTPTPRAVTLWHCAQCDALVTIQSPHIVGEAFCPVCVQAPLEYCGSFNGIPNLQKGNA